MSSPKCSCFCSFFSLRLRSRAVKLSGLVDLLTFWPPPGMVSGTVRLVAEVERLPLPFPAAQEGP